LTTGWLRKHHVGTPPCIPHMTDDPMETMDLLVSLGVEYAVELAVRQLREWDGKGYRVDPRTYICVPMSGLDSWLTMEDDGDDEGNIASFDWPVE